MAGLAHKLYTVIELLSKRRKEENWNGIIVVCVDNVIYLFIYLFITVISLYWFLPLDVIDTWLLRSLTPKSTQFKNSGHCQFKVVRVHKNIKGGRVAQSLAEN